MQPKAEELRFMTKNDGAVHIHPSSINYTVILFYIIIMKCMNYEDIYYFRTFFVHKYLTFYSV